MKYNPKVIQHLLLKASTKSGVELSHKYFVDICEDILHTFPEKPPISPKFLYEGLYLKVLKAIQEKKEFIEIRKREYINLLSKYAGYSSYQEALQVLSDTIPPVLLSCEGDWYFYVRDSTGRDSVLRSPVKIWEENHEIKMLLRGKYRWFEGQIRYKSGGLFAVLCDEDNEKELHLVFKAGIYREAEILRGVFCGFSSEGLPVAGKVFLVRQVRQSFEDLTIKKFNLDDRFVSNSKVEKAILEALKLFEGNYLRVTSLKGFDINSI